jgi:hypothetical protein
MVRIMGVYLDFKASMFRLKKSLPHIVTDSDLRWEGLWSGCALEVGCSNFSHGTLVPKQGCVLLLFSGDSCLQLELFFFSLLFLPISWCGFF